MTANNIFNTLRQMEERGSIANPTGNRSKPMGNRPRPQPRPNPQPLPKQGYTGGGWWDGGTAEAGSLSGAWGGFTPASMYNWLQRFSSLDHNAYQPHLNPEGLIPYAVQGNDWWTNYGNYIHEMEGKYGTEFEWQDPASSLEPYNYGSSGQFGQSGKVRPISGYTGSKEYLNTGGG